MPRFGAGGICDAAADPESVAPQLLALWRDLDTQSAAIGHSVWKPYGNIGAYNGNLSH
jgi:hypothetical protein